MEKVNVQEIKAKILQFIGEKGPSLPSHIVNSIKVNMLFASAILAELASERKLRMSYMKIGGSPLYFTPGAENKLEPFFTYLPAKEKEAFLMLQEKKVLPDSEQTPAIRVALRSLKDFAFPIIAHLPEGRKEFWRYLAFPEEEAKKHISEKLLKKPIPGTEKKQILPAETLIKSEEKKPAEITSHTKEEVVKENIEAEKPSQAETKETALIEKEETEKNETAEAEEKFSKTIKNWLSIKDIETISVLLEKKREFSAIVRIDYVFGKQEYLLIAKDKKKVGENDLAVALQKANSEKMPCLFLSPGETDKKALTYLDKWRNLIKFEKL